jgi:hypothetical protein
VLERIRCPRSDDLELAARFGHRKLIHTRQRYEGRAVCVGPGVSELNHMSERVADVGGDVIVIRQGRRKTVVLGLVTGWKSDRPGRAGRNRKADDVEGVGLGEDARGRFQVDGSFGVDRV